MSLEWTIQECNKHLKESKGDEKKRRKVLHWHEPWDDHKCGKIVKPYKIKHIMCVTKMRDLNVNNHTIIDFMVMFDLIYLVCLASFSIHKKKKKNLETFVFFQIFEVLFVRV